MLPDEKNPERLHLAERICFIIASVTAALLVSEFLLRDYIDVSIPAKITLALLMAVCYYAAAFLNHRRTGNVRLLRIVQMLLFLLFIAFVLDATLLGFSVRRVHYTLSREEYRYWFCNFTPFATVKNYIRGYEKGYFLFWYMILNLLGNLFLLAPLSLFLPLLFPPERRFYVFLPTLLFCSAAVEALQYLFMRGSCDIDDLLLNFIGAAMLFFACKIPSLRRLIRRLTISEF